jgi:hypothetical protein
MKLALAILVVIIATAIVIAVLLAFKKHGNREARDRKKAQTLEEKLSVLEACGLKLASPFTPDELLKSWDRDKYETEGFDLVLVGLGMTEEQPSWRNHCVNLWHFDTECIEDHGDYKKIAERMVEMTQGSLTLEDIQDYVDVEQKQAWLSFVFGEQRVKIDFKVEDDWVDAAIFTRFVDLLKRSDPSKIFVYYNLGGQDCILGCVTRRQFDDLKSNGLRFVPLT